MKSIIIANLDGNCCDCVMNIDDAENSIELEFNHVSFSEPVIHIKSPSGTTYQITNGVIEGSLNRTLKYTLPKFYWNVSGEITVWVTDGSFTSNNIIIQCVPVESYQNIRVENIDSKYIIRTFGKAKTLQEQIDEINDNLIYVISSDEKKTHDTFWGKPVYTKSFKFSTAVSANTPYSLAHGLSNIGYIWIDMQNSFMFTTNNSLCVPVVSSMYGGSTGTGNNWTCSVNKSSVYVYADGGWNTAWEKCITIRYTKTTD